MTSIARLMDRHPQLPGSPAIRLALLVSVLLGSTPAGAAPGVAARLTPDGLQALADALVLLAPREFALGPSAHDLGGCPFETQSWLDVHSSQVKVDWLQSIVTTKGGRLNIQVSVDLEAEADAEATVCSVLGAACKARLHSDRAVISVSLVPQLDGARVRLLDPQVEIGVASSRTTISFNDCGLTGGVLNLAAQLLKGSIIDAGRGLLKTLAETELPALFESALTGLTHYSATFDDRYQVDAALTAIELSGAGLGVDIDLASSALRQGPCVQADPAAGGAIAVPTSAPNFETIDDRVAVAVSVATLGDALTNAWRTGLLCLSYRGDPANRGILQMAELLLKVEAIEQIGVTPTQPPQLTPIPGDGASFAVTLPGLQIAIGTADAGSEIALAATLTARGKVALDRDKGALTLAVGDAKLSDGSTLDGGPLPDGLLESLNAAVGTLLKMQLSDLSLLPQASVLADSESARIYVYFSRLSGDAQYVYLYGGLFAHANDDQQAPETAFVGVVPATLQLEELSIVAGGRDDHTPTPLLTYHWRVDGGAWQGPTGNPRLKLGELALGAHSVDVAAIDLNGNVDASPATTRFEIVPPVISATGPSSTLAPGVVGDAGSGGCALTGASGAPSSVLLALALLLLLRRRRG